jgi:hypothetical protein
LLIDATEHPMIRRAVEDRWPWARLEPLLADVAQACDAGDDARIVARLREAVAGYVPEASGTPASESALPAPQPVQPIPAG